MTDPIWLDAENTTLRLTREDGSVLILEAWSDPDLFERASTGAFGAITAFDPAVHIDPLTADDIKAEAHRRIVAIIPEWKQRNLTAQATVWPRRAGTTGPRRTWPTGPPGPRSGHRSPRCAPRPIGSRPWTPSRRITTMTGIGAWRAPTPEHGAHRSTH